MQTPSESRLCVRLSVSVLCGIGAGTVWDVRDNTYTDFGACPTQISWKENDFQTTLFWFLKTILTNFVVCISSQQLQLKTIFVLSVEIQIDADLSYVFV